MGDQSEHRTIRWKLRFLNFGKAWQTLERILAIDSPNEAEKMGLIQAFEIAFELAWKTIKDYLYESGYDIKTPRDAIKQGFQIELIDDGQLWLEALEKRNMMAHTYDGAIAEQVDENIRQKFSPMIKRLYLKLGDLTNND